MSLKDSNVAADVTLFLTVDATKALTFLWLCQELTFGNTAVLLVYPVKSIAIQSKGLVFVIPIKVD